MTIQHVWLSEEGLQDRLAECRAQAEHWQGVATICELSKQEELAELQKQCDQEIQSLQEALRGLSLRLSFCLPLRLSLCLSALTSVPVCPCVCPSLSAWHTAVCPYVFPYICHILFDLQTPSGSKMCTEVILVSRYPLKAVLQVKHHCWLIGT